MRPAPDWCRREALLAAAGAAFAPAFARAQAPAAPEVRAVTAPPGPAPDPAPVAPGTPPPDLTADDLVRLQLGEDGARRMHVQARVNGQGPFPFLIDTGADHSVLSVELAHALHLPVGGEIKVNGMAGSIVAAKAEVKALEVGSRRLTDVGLAVLPRDNLGALGFIGLDCLDQQSIVIDFGARRLEVRRSRGFREDPDAIVVHGKARFGRLILVDSTVRRTPIFVVLDSGAQDSIANPALRGLLEQRRRSRGQADTVRPVQLLSVTGQTATGDQDTLPELTLGGVQLRDVPIIYADLPVFDRYHLAGEPALLLGMDVLRFFRRIGVDFLRREVAFNLPDTGTIRMKQA